jgi:hypothetical protein
VENGSDPMTRKVERHEGEPALPESVKPVHDAIVALTDAFCREHLNEEYRSLCRRLTATLARKCPSPLFRSRPHIWACAIVRVIGQVNLLDANSQVMCLNLTEIDWEFGVSTATAQARSKQVWATLKIRQDDPQWTLPSRLERISHARREAQVVPFSTGLVSLTPCNRQGQGETSSRVSKAMPKSASPFTGRWRILSMSAWEDEDLDEEVQAFFEFEETGSGSFQFGYIQGLMDWRTSSRDGKPAMEFSWEGGDGTDGTALTGHGWVVLEGDELNGSFFIHQGEKSEFVAKRPDAPKAPKRKKRVE